MRLHWSCGGFVLFSVVRRVALVSVCALIVGGFVCRVGGCDLRLLVLFVRVARAVLDVALRDSPSFWSRAAVSYYPPSIRRLALFSGDSKVANSRRKPSVFKWRKPPEPTGRGKRPVPFWKGQTRAPFNVSGNPHKRVRNSQRATIRLRRKGVIQAHRSIYKLYGP